MEILTKYIAEHEYIYELAEIYPVTFKKISMRNAITRLLKKIKLILISNLYLTKILTILFLFLSITSCQKEEKNLTATEKQEIIDSAKNTVQKVFECSNRLEFIKGLDYYSNDTNAYYTNNGTVLSLKDLKSSYSQIGPEVETLHNTIDIWNATVISKDIVAFTLPIHLKIKLKGLPEYNGQLVWSGIVKKNEEKWMIIQSHESWLNCVEVAAALTPKN